MLDIMPDRELAIVNVKEIKQIGKEREENDINWVVLWNKKSPCRTKCPKFTWQLQVIWHIIRRPFVMYFL